MNNAGILHLHEIDDDDEDQLRESSEINVVAPYRLTVAALPHLRKTGAGWVVNINSRSGLRYRHRLDGLLHRQARGHGAKPRLLARMLGRRHSRDRLPRA